MWIGNSTHKVNILVNRNFLKMKTSDFKIQLLNESAALELGVETFYEIIIYSCILGLPIMELYKSVAESREKSAK